VDDTASDDDVFSELAHGDSPQFTTVGTTVNSNNSSSKRHRAATTDQLQQQQQQHYTLDHYEDTTAAGAAYVHDDEQQYCDSNAVYDAAACMHDEALQGGFGRGVEADGSVILYREGEGKGTLASYTYTSPGSSNCLCFVVVH
jgi:hypothetical protein